MASEAHMCTAAVARVRARAGGRQPFSLLPQLGDILEARCELPCSIMVAHKRIAQHKNELLNAMMNSCGDDNDLLKRDEVLPQTG